MFNAAGLDDREKLIFDAADEWFATRFLGRGTYDKLGPFKTAQEAVSAIMAFFRAEERDYPPPASVASRPFAVYAASSEHNGAHVIVGNVYRDGKYRPTNREISQQRQEEKARVATKRRPSNRRNKTRSD